MDISVLLRESNIDKYIFSLLSIVYKFLNPASTNKKRVQLLQINTTRVHMARRCIKKRLTMLL